MLMTSSYSRLVIIYVSQATENCTFKQLRIDLSWPFRQMRLTSSLTFYNFVLHKKQRPYVDQTVEMSCTHQTSCNVTIVIDVAQATQLFIDAI